MTGRTREEIRVVVCLFLVLFLGVADSQVIIPLLPKIASQLKETTQSIGLLFTAYAACAALSGLFWGPLSDAFGRKPALLLGLGLLSFGSATSALSDTFIRLLVGRTLTGMGASLLSLNVISYAGDYFPYAHRGWAMSSIFAAHPAALILGLPLVGLMGDWLGPTGVFGAVAAGGILQLVLLPWLLPAVAPPGPGTVRARDTIRRYGEFLAGRETLGALLGSLFASGGILGFMAYIGIWLSENFDLTGAEIGRVFIIPGCAAIVASPIAGSLSDRIGKKVLVVSASVLMALLLLGLPSAAWGVGLLALFCAISLAWILRQGPLEALVTEVVETKSRGTFVALRNASSQLGIAGATAVAGLLFSNSGYAAVCLLCAILNVAAAGSIWWLLRRKEL